MHKLILLLAFFLAVPAQATQIWLRDSSSPLAQIATAGLGYGCDQNAQDTFFRQAINAQGSAAVTKTYTPSSTAPPCLWQTALAAGNQFLYWITAPVSVGVTISGNINYQAGCAESNTSLNGGFRFKVMRWSVAAGGIVSTIMTSATSTECAGANIAIAAAPPTSTTLAVGDRIVFIVETMNVGTWAGNNSRTISLVYGAATGVYGDSFANFVDTISFASDTNNARARVP